MERIKIGRNKYNSHKKNGKDCIRNKWTEKIIKFNNKMTISG